MEKQIEEYLRANWQKALTYNQVAEGIGHEITKDNAREFKGILDRLAASETSGVVVARLSKTSKLDNKRHALYQFSRKRKKYDSIRDPAKRDRYVQQQIKSFIAAHPYATTRDIHENLRLAFCSLAADIISRNLLAVVEAGEVLVSTGSRRAVLHIVKPAE